MGSDFTNHMLTILLQDSVFGSNKPDTADPVMIGRRALLENAWNAFASKLDQVKQVVLPKLQNASEVKLPV